ncbi:hypothetical protein I6N95_24885 [Vagococcus sp. BWB3-3]|uniref:Uncharacterized protein n=1 Tax=Vagococcus allomyrinae TaxID=2794353 RepID=A0A940SZB1_9ENTE|nr:hypothetical protein [Vagococcus allomyrinae]MBP1044248.1 hypothetical protein [Vagococcus allomyrinae]
MDNQEQRLIKLILEISKIDLQNSLDDQINNIKKNYEIDNLNNIFNALTKVNKAHIKKIQTVVSPSTQHTVKVTTKNKKINFSEKEIEEIFQKNDINDINRNYTKKEVETMYICLTKSKPLTSLNKFQIIKNIDSKYKSIHRAKKIHENYTLSV